MDELRALITSIGATAELVGIFRKELRNQGIPDSEAIQLTRQFLHDILTLNRNKEDN